MDAADYEAERERLTRLGYPAAAPGFIPEPDWVPVDSVQHAGGNGLIGLYDAGDVRIPLVEHPDGSVQIGGVGW